MWKMCRSLGEFEAQGSKKRQLRGSFHTESDLHPAASARLLPSDKRLSLGLKAKCGRFSR